MTGGAPAPVRYAVRQVLDQEYRKSALRVRSENRLARDTAHCRLDALGANEDQKENTGAGSTKQAISIGGKRDFFGRIINEVTPGSAAKGAGSAAEKTLQQAGERVWVSFHEGYSNAVRKPITLKEFLSSF